MQPPKTLSNQPTIYTSIADYERDRREREAAGMAQAVERLTAESVARSTVESFAQVTAHPKQGESPADIVQDSEPLTIRVDVELARVAVGLKHAHLFRVWMILLQNARETNVNYLSRADLPVLLAKYGVECSERNLNRWLRRGHGLYWILTPYGRIKFDVGYNELSKRLSLYADEIGLPDLVSTNRPGQGRYMYVETSGSLQQFEANVYAAWLAFHNNPTIARSTLELLWNRWARVLREWEASAGIEVIAGDAHYTSDHTDAIPVNDDGSLRGDVFEYNVKGKTRWKAKASNTYHAPAVKQHNTRGQSRAVGREVLELLEADNPAGNCEQETLSNPKVSGGLQRSGKLNFSDHKHAKQSAKRLGDKPRYVPIGRDRFGAIQWEYTPNGQPLIALGECPLAFRFGGSNV